MSHTTQYTAGQANATAGQAAQQKRTMTTKKPAKSGTTACLACRDQHLKCDGAHPCSRCVSTGRGQDECVFVQSRRGYKGKPPKKGLVQNPNKRKAVSSPDQDSHDRYAPPGMCAPQRKRNSSSPASSNGQSPNSSSTHSQRLSGDAASGTDVTNYDLSPQGRSTSQVSTQSLSERCIDSFYTHFHGAHPFVLPKEFLLRVSHEEAVEPLMAAMRWVGSLYIDVPSARESLLQEAQHRLRGIPHEIRDGFTLQTMMVLIVALDGTAQNETAREMLLDAEKLAHDIAINTKVFASFHGRESPVLEESWRRTWWDLLVIDGMIAGVHRATHFALFDVPADVDLPCEEAEFISGNIPPPRSLSDLLDLDFATPDSSSAPFSSFAYRILCAHNLGKFMRTPPILTTTDPNLARIQAVLTNWSLHLPSSKRQPLDQHGRVDEMLFQAHMMHHATSLLLHQPHSQLDPTPAASITACAPQQAVLLTETPFNAHTRHTLTSATAISHLVSLPVPSLTTHTHFFTCVLTLSSIVHLCKWALHFIQYDDDDLRQLVRLNIGALNELAGVWPAADRARGQVRRVATDIFTAKKEVQQAPTFWMGLEKGVMEGTLETDKGIMADLEGEGRQW